MQTTLQRRRRASCGLHFIVGCEILLTTVSDTPFARLVLLAQDCRGHGNPCEVITMARRRAIKGLYKALVAGAQSKAPRARTWFGRAPAAARWGCTTIVPRHMC